MIMPCGLVDMAAVIDMVATMVSMTTPLVAGLRGSALPVRSTSKVDLTSGDDLTSSCHVVCPPAPL
jgi:hypothetical protein